MLIFTAQVSGSKERLIFVEVDGRRLLYSGDSLVAFQGPDAVEGGVVDAEEWQFSEEKYATLLPLLVSLHDQPSFAVIPGSPDGAARNEDSASVLYVHSSQTVDEYARSSRR